MKIQTSQTPLQQPSTADRLKVAAVELEAAFLAEMLRSSGLGKTRDAFGGGAGEDQFSSFLVQQQAMQLAHSGGVGLSELIFKSMTERCNDT